MRSGNLKSRIAAPSRRNSGLETTATSASGRASRMIRSTSSPVPTGTVDLVTRTGNPSSAAAQEIAAALDGFTGVVTKSPGRVGSGDEVERIIREARPDAEVAVVSNPEFLREGAAIQ